MVTYGDMKTMFINEKNQAARELRKKFTGEVFTPRKLVSQMLNKLPKEVWLKGKTFCDPAVGNGRFLTAFLIRKINRGHHPLDALKTLYGVDIMRNNIEECRWFLLKTCEYYGEVKITEEYISTVFKNIVWINSNRYPGGSLDYDFSFKNVPKQETIDRWMDQIYKDNALDRVELPVEEEEFTPNDEKGYNSVFGPEDML